MASKLHSRAGKAAHAQVPVLPMAQPVKLGQLRLFRSTAANLQRLQLQTMLRALSLNSSPTAGLQARSLLSSMAASMWQARPQGALSKAAKQAGPMHCSRAACLESPLLPARVQAACTCALSTAGLLANNLLRNTAACLDKGQQPPVSMSASHRV